MFGIEINSCNTSSFTFQKDRVCIFGRIMSCRIFIKEEIFFIKYPFGCGIFCKIFCIGMNHVIQNSLSVRCYKLLLKLNQLCSCKGLRKNCKKVQCTKLYHLFNYHQVYFPKVDQVIKWINDYIWSPFTSC